MKMKIKSLENKDVNEIELPKQFNEEIRDDLIHRAYLTYLSNKRQKYGAKPDAGLRASAELSRRRRKYRGSYGLGISRVPRKIMSRRGTRFNWVGAVVPGTVSGRRAHPPKSEKEFAIKLNTKEKKKAIRSAMHASLSKEYVSERGHIIPNNYPFVIDNNIEKLSKTSDVKKTLITLGFGDELKRAEIKKVRAGRGKSRGRKYKTRKGPLFVVSKSCDLQKSAKNIPGIDVEVINNLNAKLLAPGGKPGRLTLYSQDAIQKLNEKKLFV